MPTAVADKRFREDLLFRINTFELQIAPLRQRKDDLPLLFDIFAERAAENFDRPYEKPPAKLWGGLLAHEWSGNVRELKNLAERYVLLTGNAEERWARLFGNSIGNGAADPADKTGSLADQLRHFEQHIIRDALTRHNGNVKTVMDELDIPRRTLNEKMKKLNIRRDTIEER